MDKNVEFNAFVIISLLVAFWIITWWYNSRKKKAHEAAVSALRDEYQKALRTGDKVLALDLGRRYYSKLRGGKLSIYDEQALTNDLSTMK